MKEKLLKTQENKFKTQPINEEGISTKEISSNKIRNCNQNLGRDIISQKVESSMETLIKIANNKIERIIFKPENSQNKGSITNFKGLKTSQEPFLITSENNLNLIPQHSRVKNNNDTYNAQDEKRFNIQSHKTISELVSISYNIEYPYNNNYCSDHNIGIPFEIGGINNFPKKIKSNTSTNLLAQSNNLREEMTTEFNKKYKSTQEIHSVRNFDTIKNGQLNSYVIRNFKGSSMKDIPTLINTSDFNKISRFNDAPSLRLVIKYFVAGLAC